LIKSNGPLRSRVFCPATRGPGRLYAEQYSGVCLGSNAGAHIRDL